MEQNHFPKTRHTAFSLIPDTHTHVCSSLCAPHFPGNLENPGTCSQSNAYSSCVSSVLLSNAFPLHTPANSSSARMPLLILLLLGDTFSVSPQALCPVLPTLRSSTIISKSNESNVLHFFPTLAGSQFFRVRWTDMIDLKCLQKWQYTHLLIYKPHYRTTACGFAKLTTCYNTALPKTGNHQNVHQ